MIIHPTIAEGIKIMGGDAVTVNAAAICGWIFAGVIDPNNTQYHNRLADLRADLAETDGQMILESDTNGVRLFDNAGNSFCNPPGGSFRRFTI